MTRLLAERAGLGLLTLLAVSALLFFGTNLLPGDVASALLGQDAAPEDIAPIDVVAAHLELDIGEPSAVKRAERMALHAAETAERIPLPVVACQAWQLLGALTRQHDPELATAYLERSRAFADLELAELLERRKVDRSVFGKRRRQCGRCGGVGTHYLTCPALRLPKGYRINDRISDRIK